MGRKIEDLIGSLGKLTDEELLERVRTIRKDRRTTKMEKYTKPKAQRRISERDKAKKLLAALSPEERKILMERMMKG